jgi:hypothetical protein
MFSIYSEQTGGVPLWQETQNVQFAQGRYAVFLGESTSAGIPAELFASGQPRWLGVKPLLPGEEEQPRVLLASVPLRPEGSGRGHSGRITSVGVHAGEWR